MTGAHRDRSLDALLDLDGEVLFIDDKHWVKFRVRRIEPSAERPHGLSYALTLHDENGERLVGFDNAHPVPGSAGPGGKKDRKHDHRHRQRTVRPYVYEDAGKPLADFWAEVDAVLNERGVIR